MWRGFAKRASKERLRFLSIPTSNPVQDSCFNVVYHQFSGPSCQNPNLSRPSCSIRFNGLPQFCKGYGTSAAQVVVSTDESELSGSDELLEIIRETEEPEGKLAHPFRRPRRKTMMAGMGVAKYAMLKKRQVKMETDAWEQAAKEYEELLSDMCEQKLAPNLPYVKSLFLGWFEPLRNAIKTEQKVAKNNFRCPYGQYFDQLPADMMAVITMHKMMGMLLTSNGGEGNVKVVLAALAVGEAIEQEARIYKVMEKTKHKRNVKHNELDGESNALTHDEQKSDKEQDKLIQEKLRKKMAVLMKKQKCYALRKVVKGQDDSVPWGQDMQAKVGSRMIQLLIETAYIQPPVDQINDCPPDIRPAFVHAMKTVADSQHHSKRYGVIECDPLVRRGLEKSARHMVIPYLPMLVPPLNWRGYDKGAYFFLPSFVMRTHGAKQQREAVKRTPLEQLEPVFEALDTLGNTKWRVNKRVLAVVDRIWVSGGRLASLVDREDLAFPEEPDTEDEAEIKKWKWQVKNTKKENSERHSQRCDVELKLSVARKLRDEEGFYYPHNLDFRGRAYPMHPHLNHLGSDLCRGILEFAEGRPLGKSGLQWLKIHLANQYGGGVDKLSFGGRAAFAENHINDIFDSADQPLEGRRWWLSAEDPFQCLATCINLAEALRSSSPHTTISHLPIHQDGSCNGLQHYAALGRDELGAASVNLVGQEKPADVYSRIAERVLDIMRKDAEKDPATDPDALLARALVHQVDRKLVKQTVMTSVYGVTYVGARDQINRRLKERGAVTDDPWKPACYAAKTTLKALEEMFDGARSIMAWLGECAKLIAKTNKPVRWTTPLGLPVVQPYFKEERHLIKTSLQTLALKRDTDKVKAVKQRTAFPPNFVHSLDGSHMMMTAVACKKAGLNFAGVHDSYWTHASDVDEMNRILREKFVELYETPILENMLEGFEKSFPGLKFPPLPKRGDFDLKRVLESQYFFN